MGALIKDRDTKRRAGLEFNWPVAAGVRIFAGAVVCLNGQGWAVPATAVTGLNFMALALRGVDNLAGANGDQFVPVDRTVVSLDGDSDVTRATIGQPVYLADDHTVSADGTGKSRAGLLVDIHDDQCWVDLTR